MTCPPSSTCAAEPSSSSRSPVAAGTSAGGIVTGSRATATCPSGETSGSLAAASPGSVAASRRKPSTREASAVRQTTSTVSGELAGKRSTSASAAALESEPGVA